MNLIIRNQLVNDRQSFQLSVVARRNKFCIILEWYPILKQDKQRKWYSHGLYAVCRANTRRNNRSQGRAGVFESDERQWRRLSDYWRRRRSRPSRRAGIWATAHDFDCLCPLTPSLVRVTTTPSLQGSSKSSYHLYARCNVSHLDGGVRRPAATPPHPLRACFLYFLAKMASFYF